MKRNEILQAIKEIFNGEDYVISAERVESITEQTSLVNDLVLDSLQILHLVVLIERKFNFTCDEEELELDLFDHVSNLIDFIEKRKM